MAENKTTTQETAASSLTGAELIRGVQSGGMVKITADQISDYSNGVPVVNSRAHTPTAMPALAVNVAAALNTLSVSADQSLTFSNNTPTAGTTFELKISADSTARVITFPTTIWSVNRNGNLPSNQVTVPASGMLDLFLVYTGARWEISGDPVATTGTGTKFVTDAGPTITTLTNAGASYDTGIISPSQLSADADDWNPSGLAGATEIRIDTDASLRSLLSLAGGTSGRRLKLTNVSANTLLIADQRWALGTTAANRFILGRADYPLFPNESIWIKYDGTSSRWRLDDGANRLHIPRQFGFIAQKPFFYNTTSDNYLGMVTSGSGSGATAAATAADAYSGTMYIALPAGTDNGSGRNGINANSTLLLLGNNRYWATSWYERLPAASDGTTRYTFRGGFVDTISGTDPTDGVFLRYVDNVNSGNWVGVLRQNGSETPTNGSLGPVFSSTAFAKLSVVVTPTRVGFFQNDVLVVYVTDMTNLPSGSGRQTGLGMFITKSVGTGNSTHDIASVELVCFNGVP